MTPHIDTLYACITLHMHAPPFNHIVYMPLLYCTRTCRLFCAAHSQRASRDTPCQSPHGAASTCSLLFNEGLESHFPITRNITPFTLLTTHEHL